MIQVKAIQSGSIILFMKPFLAWKPARDTTCIIILLLLFEVKNHCLLGVNSWPPQGYAMILHRKTANHKNLYHYTVGVTFASCRNHNLFLGPKWWCHTSLYNIFFHIWQNNCALCTQSHNTTPILLEPCLYKKAACVDFMQTLEQQQGAPYCTLCSFSSHSLHASDRVSCLNTAYNCDYIYEGERE